MDEHWIANSRKVNRGLSGSRTHLLLVSCTCFLGDPIYCLIGAKTLSVGNGHISAPPRLYRGLLLLLDSAASVKLRGREIDDHNEVGL